MTARNTIINTDVSFTCAGEEIRKGGQLNSSTETFNRLNEQHAAIIADLKPDRYVIEDAELNDLEVAAINLESIELDVGGQLTSRSSEVTINTGCSSQRSQPMDTARRSRVRRGSCGSGSRSRARECTNPSPSNGGADCSGDSTDTADCNTEPCPGTTI